MKLSLLLSLLTLFFLSSSHAWSPSKLSHDATTRRSFFSSLLIGGGAVIQSTNANADEDESFASIAERASKMSQAIQQEEAAQPSFGTTPRRADDSRTAYDFSLPMAGIQTPFADIVRNQDNTVKAILVLNIKQDDPMARKNIPELIALAAKFGRSGEFAVVACPTDQGYYEPDTSALIRLKLASEYGYGINPATVVTDKVNLLGTGAHPFWRWLEGNCRTPAGLGKIQANFEKFLIDGKTGLPLRRYPRKYQPYDIENDIASLLADKPLPPPGANWKEEWRMAVKDAEADTYRFQKGLNFYDQ